MGSSVARLPAPEGFGSVSGAPYLPEGWGWLLFFGILMVVAGVFAVAWPGPTVLVLAILFGIQILVSGIFSFINAFATDESGGMRVWNVILGLLGIWLIIYGIMEIALAFRVRSAVHHVRHVVTSPT